MYTASDFEFLRDRLNGDLGGGTSLLSNDVRLQPSRPQSSLCRDGPIKLLRLLPSYLSKIIVYDLGATPTAMEFKSFDGWNVQAVVQWVHAYYSRRKC